MHSTLSHIRWKRVARRGSLPRAVTAMTKDQRQPGQWTHSWTLDAVLYPFLSWDLLYFRDGKNKKGKRKTRKKQEKGK